jgi:hypothetical protein
MALRRNTSRRKVRRNSRANPKAPIVGVSWSVSGVAEGDARTIREAERKILAAYSHVDSEGALPAWRREGPLSVEARFVIHRADGSRATQRRSIFF